MAPRCSDFWKGNVALIDNFRERGYTDESRTSESSLTARPFPTDLSLQAAGLTLVRGSRTILSGLSLRLASGEALVVTGANGAGKSTLLRAIAGLLRPEVGTIRLEGSQEPEIPALSAHYIGHADAMKATLTAQENLTFWTAMLHTSGIGLQPQEALAAFGLAHVLHLPVGYLSAGQKRRVALARLLVAPRPLWLLDEPTTALDVGAQAQLAALMQAHVAAGGMIMAATHGALGLAAPRSLHLGSGA
jgi:heme exporter protein A